MHIEKKTYGDRESTTLTITLEKGVTEETQRHEEDEKDEQKPRRLWKM